MLTKTLAFRNRDRPDGGYRRALLPATLVLAVSCLPLLTGGAYPRWDASNFFAPAQILVAGAARDGGLLLWDPWIAGGAPDAADPQLGAFSPVNVALGWILGPSIRGFTLYWLLVWWWGALGIVVLARHLRAPAWGAAVAAVGFVSSGFFVGHAQHTAIVASMAWLPFTIWRLDAALAGGRWLPAAQAGALWGLSALAGYPAMTILNGFYMALWTLGRLVCGRLGPPRTAGLRAAAILALVVVVGAVVLSPAYVAFFFEGRGYTDRTAALAKDVALGSNALDPGALASFASPYVAVLDLVDEERWPYTESSNSSIYAAAAVFLLAVLAVAGRPRDRWRIVLAVLALFLLGCALGRSLPFRGWLFELLPPMRYFRHAVIFRGYYLFTVCVLALLATRDLQEGSGDARRRLLVVVGVSAAAVLVLVRTAAGIDLSASHFLAASAIAALFWLASALLLMACQVRDAARRRLPLLLLVAVVSLDGGAAVRLSRYFVSDWSAEAHQLWRRVEQSRAESSAAAAGAFRHVRSRFGTDPNNRNAVAREAVFESHFGLRSSYYAHWLGNDVLTAAVTGESRFCFATRAIEVPWTPSAFELFDARSRELDALPVLVHRRGEVLSVGGVHPRPSAARLDAAPACRPVGVDIVRYEADEVELRVDVPQAGILLMADRFARGWRAWVDGVETRVLPASFLFRAIEVPAGRRHVTMRYRPAGHPWLLFLGWGTLAAIAAISLRSAWPSSP